MSFFNKKTEVMQIEMTPYGRYLYSIGKFMPHSYEFVDDDVIYRMSGSNEVQESANFRILNETPKLKINRAFQDEAPQVESPPTIDKQRSMVKKMNMRQPDLLPLGRSSYSTDGLPQIQVTMLQGLISGSTMTHTFSGSNEFGQGPSLGGEVLIPQVNINVNFTLTLKNVLSPSDDYDGEHIRSATQPDGRYMEIRYKEPIIHMKEFNSFYEKENFEVEVFKVENDPSTGTDILRPLLQDIADTSIVNDILVDEGEDRDQSMSAYDLTIEDAESSNFLDYFFSIEKDEEIEPEILCKIVNSLEINSQFLDEELICPDQRTERFNIYNTRVDPSDLEDCDDE